MAFKNFTHYRSPPSHDRRHRPAVSSSCRSTPPPQHDPSFRQFTTSPAKITSDNVLGHSSFVSPEFTSRESLLKPHSRAREFLPSSRLDFQSNLILLSLFPLISEFVIDLSGIPDKIKRRNVKRKEKKSKKPRNGKTGN